MSNVYANCLTKRETDWPPKEKEIKHLRHYGEEKDTVPLNTIWKKKWPDLHPLEKPTDPLELNSRCFIDDRECIPIAIEYVSNFNEAVKVEFTLFSRNKAKITRFVIDFTSMNIFGPIIVVAPFR